jgi:hypothetical protein
MSTDGNESVSRRERLLEAIRRLKEMNGSPDLLKSCLKALEELPEGS